MDCPNCGAVNLLTVETYKTKDKIYRVKKCRSEDCRWTFTSHEVIAEDLTIPGWVRDFKRLGRKKAEELHKEKMNGGSTEPKADS